MNLIIRRKLHCKFDFRFQLNRQRKLELQEHAGSQRNCNSRSGNINLKTEIRIQCDYYTDRKLNAEIKR